MEAAANAEPLQRQNDKPVPSERGEAVDKATQPASEQSCEPRLEQSVAHSPEPGPETQIQGLRHAEGRHRHEAEGQSRQHIRSEEKAAEPSLENQVREEPGKEAEDE